jgi:uncharacterized protein YggU (UPF0235/DUF167 family)
VRLTPRGGVDRVDGVGEDGALRVRVAAPPVDSAANEALCRLLAQELEVARGGIRIVTGATARRKVVAVVGIEAPVVRSRWPGLAV